MGVIPALGTRPGWKPLSVPTFLGKPPCPRGGCQAGVRTRSPWERRLPITHKAFIPRSPPCGREGRRGLGIGCRGSRTPILATQEVECPGRMPPPGSTLCLQDISQDLPLGGPLSFSGKSPSLTQLPNSLAELRGGRVGQADGRGPPSPSPVLALTEATGRSTGSQSSPTRRAPGVRSARPASQAASRPGTMQGGSVVSAPLPTSSCGSGQLRA